MQPYKILIKFPSRGRKDRFFKALEACINNIQDKDNYSISCTLDFDDPVMNNDEVKEKIASYDKVLVEWGKSDSKIHAINRDLQLDFDILVVLSDDIFFNIFGWDTLVRMEMENNFPDGDGYLHFKEHDTRDILNVMTVIDKKYYQRFNYIYHPSYKSLWCDNHQMAVAKILKRYKYIPFEIMLHRCPAYGYLDCPRDEMFNRQQKDWQEDELNFKYWQSKNFDL
jgi:hypothetical protein